MRRFLDAQHAAWVEAIEEEASHLKEGRTRWLLGGLLGLVCYRLTREIWNLLALIILPLAAIVLFTALARAQFLIWNSKNLLIGPIILAISIVPFAWQIGRRFQSHPILCAALAFILFQSAPVVFWPVFFGSPASLVWGINVEALGIPPMSAPLLTLTLWLTGTLTGIPRQSRVTEPAP